MRGDWEEKGYVLRYCGITDSDRIDSWVVHTIQAYAPSGQVVGRYDFIQHREGLFPNTANTSADHRRKGLATAAYSLIEQLLEKTSKTPR
jgi:hypothetical protein